MRKGAHLAAPEADLVENLGGERLLFLAVPMPWTLSGSPTMSAADMRGFNDENGSWKIICIWRRSGAVAVLPRRVTSLPAITIDRRSARMRRITVRATVDLPQPELADQPQRLARADREADPVDGVDLTDGAAQQPLFLPGSAS